MIAENATSLIQDWSSFYVSIGVPQNAVSGKHADCPLCGSVSGFRTSIINKPGVWVCKHCSNSEYSSGLDFVKRFAGLSSYKEAAAFIYKHFEVGGAVLQATKPLVQKTSQADFEKEVIKRQWIWEKVARKVVEGDPVWKYLKRRIPKLNLIPDNIRFLEAAQYWEKDESGKARLVGEFPAMLVRGFDPQDQCVQLHTTYLTHDGNKAKVTNPKKTRTSIGSNSYAFRLDEIDSNGFLGLAEGIETALACSVRFGVPVWSCHSCSVLANFEIPISLVSKVRKIVIYADNDGWRVRPDGSKHNPGVDKARELAERLRKFRNQDGKRITVLICYTSRIGDFADQ